MDNVLRYVISKKKIRVLYVKYVTIILFHKYIGKSTLVLYLMVCQSTHIFMFCFVNDSFSPHKRQRTFAYNFHYLGRTSYGPTDVHTAPRLAPFNSLTRAPTYLRNILMPVSVKSLRIDFHDLTMVKTSRWHGGLRWRSRSVFRVLSDRLRLVDRRPNSQLCPATGACWFVAADPMGRASVPSVAAAGRTFGEPPLPPPKHDRTRRESPSNRTNSARLPPPSSAVLPSSIGSVVPLSRQPCPPVVDVERIDVVWSIRMSQIEYHEYKRTRRWLSSQWFILFTRGPPRRRCTQSLHTCGTCLT